ncbi:MAG: PilZ domain-containing protein [Planctomycetes bacterium]|nr:PilZ domain-containing protein [Planctomycetota bacterium]
MATEEPNPCSIETASLREADLRRHPRHVCLDGGTLRLAVRPEFRGRRALLVDLSAGGIGFVLEDAQEAGTTEVFNLQGPDGTEPVSRIARVRHSRAHPTPPDAPWLPPATGFGKIFRGLFGVPAPKVEKHAWLVGCQFDRPLSEDEINQVVAQLKSAATSQA